MDVLAGDPDYRIGRFTLKPFRQLMDGGVAVPIGRKALDLLSVLAKAEGALVTKDELMTAVWPKAIVEDNAVQVHIAALRKALGKDAEYLITVHGLGYRLAVTTETLPEVSQLEGPAQAAPAPQRWTKPVLWASLAIIAVAALGFWLLRDHQSRTPRSGEARVAVLPFDTLSDGPQARHFADALADEIATRLNSNRIQVVSRDDAATLRGSDRDRKIADLDVALVLDGTVQDEGNAVTVRVHLDDPGRHAILWSGSVDGPASDGNRLQASIADTVVAVLACANRALVPAHGLADPDLLSRYLHVCDVFVNGGRSHEDFYDLIASLRDVAAKAPDFTPVHSDLAKFAMFFSSTFPPGQAASLRREGEAEARKALALDPRSPDAHLALSWILPMTDWAGRERLLRQGVAGDPDWPHTNGFLGLLLADTGRLQDGGVFLQKAAAADLQINWRHINARMQCNFGQFEPATSDLLAKLKRNPADGDSGFGLRGCLKFARRWSELRAQATTSASNAAARNDPSSTLYNTYLVAEESGKPVDAARARNAARAAPDGGLAIANAVEALSVLGFTDDAFDVAKRYTPRAAGETAFLFSPLTAPLRRDPRFMQLAAHLGLVDYWRSSGHWADFCAGPGLPYNCRTEANGLNATK